MGGFWIFLVHAKMDEVALPALVLHDANTTHTYTSTQGGFFLLGDVSSMAVPQSYLRQGACLLSVWMCKDVYGG